VKKPKFWIILALILVFGAGVVAGVFGDRLWAVKRPPVRRSDQGHYPSIQRWARELGLSAEQQENIREIFKKNEGRIKELRTNFYKDLGEIRGQLKQEIDAVLTAEQRQKMEAMIQRSMEQRRKDSDKRERPRDSRRDQEQTKGE
jgi:Spy/CpxP family protein refolding chaperone